MVALYLAADIMLVTALRDGMNLVAKEYVAARFDNDGVLILSEFAGAADELKQAVIVNPHDIGALKDSIQRAIEMPRRERSTRMRALRKRVRDNDVARWSRSFLEALDRHAPKNAQIDPSAADPKDQHREAQTDNMSIFDQDAQTARAAEDTREARDA
jgi:trehalose 6-phosphate synthase